MRRAQMAAGISGMLLVFAVSAANAAVKIWTESVTIPTYEVLPPDPNPRFLHHRGNQGSKGNVYPHPILDRMSDKKTNKKYTAVYLENEYLKAMVLPEIGGRVHALTDKTTGYEMIYQQHVIKPALIGLFGPWCSGGIEFCFPQHHRPTTFDPVDWAMKENADGSKTAWVGETDPLYRIRGLAGITLHPGKAYLEVKIYVFNESYIPKSFLWWANVGVHVNDSCQVIYPPDVNYVTFHGKVENAKFPVPDSFYCGYNFKGIDISWLKNIPFPLSFFAGVSTFDFVGVYDHGRDAGLLHIADHAISPGKKCWTWGTGESGRIWEKNLTDSDGPYIEIMSGVFTDNQPDFSWIKPYEVKLVSQYWCPLRNMQYVKNANLDASINLDANGKTVKVYVNATAEFKDARIQLLNNGKSIAQEVATIAPDKPFAKVFSLASAPDPSKLTAVVALSDGKELIRYAPVIESKPIPQPFQPIPEPTAIKTIDELLINALHIDQYKDPSHDPDPYYQEVLRRDSANWEAKNALGVLALREGRFADAESYFRSSAQKTIEKNRNPYNTEPFFNLGAVLKLTGRFSEAKESFSKCLWDAALKAPAYYALAQIAAVDNDFTLALDRLENSLASNSRNPAALCCQSALLRKGGMIHEAIQAASSAQENDYLFFWAYNELVLCYQASGESKKAAAIEAEMKTRMRAQPESYIDVAQNYADLGMWNDAIAVLQSLVSLSKDPAKVYPMAYYYLAYYCLQNNEQKQADRYYAPAAHAAPDFCFPARLTDIAVLDRARKINPNDARACYYLGNLLYDKKQFAKGLENWERACSIKDDYWIVNRNLGLAYNEFKEDTAKAIKAYEKSLAQNPQDITTAFELLQLYTEARYDHKKRLAFLDNHSSLVSQSELLTAARAKLLIQTGKYDEAITALRSRLFHPWEGISYSLQKLYETAYLMKGFDALKEKKPDKALVDFNAALESPDNLRDHDNPANLFYYSGHIYYGIALAYEAMGNAEEAAENFTKCISATGTDNAWDRGFTVKKAAYFKGMALEKTGKTAEAKAEFASLIEQGQNSEENASKRSRPQPAIDIWYLQGLGYAGQGKKAQAEQAFKKALELDMDNLDAKMALKML